MRWAFHKPYPVAPEPELVDVPPDLRRKPHEPCRARLAAVAALRNLCSESARDGVGIVVLSGHRDWETQARLFEDAERRHGAGRGRLWVAPPGFSEHHTGYVFDLADRDRPETDDEPAFEATAASDWLAHHAPRFGFEISFPKDNWQGIGYEPWHWRFVGDSSALGLFHPPFPVRWAWAARAIWHAF